MVYSFYCIALNYICNNLYSLFLSNGGKQNMGEHGLLYEICEYVFPYLHYQCLSCVIRVTVFS